VLEQYLPLPFRRELEEAADQAGIPPWVLAGLVRQESAWNPRVVSPAGAVGLSQLIPRTARDLVRRHRLPADTGRRLTDPAGNLRIGALLLREWQRRLGGSLTVALAAYNGGERRARLFWDLAGHRDGPEFVEGIEVPETWDYVHRVVRLAEGYRALYWPEGTPYPWR
jgi:soluble lytic murein transglycosylase